MFKKSKISPVDEKTKVILLTAPTRSVTVNFGMEMPCWFDYKSFDLKDPEDFIDVEQLKESEERVVNIIKKEVEDNLNGDYKQLMIGGFSQGAALSLYVACRLEDNIGGVIFCSGHPLWVNPAEEILESKKSLPIFAYHGKADPLLQWKTAFEPIMKMEEAGFNIKTKLETGLAHSMSVEEWKDIKAFIGWIE